MTIEQALFFVVVFVFAFGFFRGGQQPTNRFGSQNSIQDPYYDYYEQSARHPSHDEPTNSSFFETFFVSLIAVLVVWFLIIQP